MTGRRSPFRVLSVVLLLVLTALGVVGVDGPPRAEADGGLTLYGHGWGHGRGMGQYGAQGYATMYGWSSAQILDHYYGGTATAALGSNPTISVWLTAFDASTPVVTSAAPFRVSDSANPALHFDQPAGNGVRSTIDAAGHIAVAAGSGCGPSTTAYTSFQGEAVFTPLTADAGADLDHLLTVCSGPTYRGSLRVLSSSGLRVVNDVALESYLRGVVPRESPASFAPAALEAQAVAARSYALAEGGETGNRYAFAKTCDTTSCQVYGGAGLNGVRRESASTDAAVAATAGLVRRFAGGALARTEFSSSTGGWTTPGNFPAVEDLGDAVPSNSRHSWSITLSTDAIGQRYGIGAFLSVTVDSRTGYGDWGGRVLSLRVVGTGGTVTLTGAAFQSDWGLYSTWFSSVAPGEAGSGPGAAAAGGSLSVAVAGSSGGAYVTKADVSGTPAAWQSLGGLVTASPELASTGDAGLDVFVRGADNGLWTRDDPGNGWQPWVSLGGGLTSGPAAVSWGAGRMDVFVTGLDGALWSRYRSGDSWSSWYSLGGRLVAAPDVSSRGPGLLDVFAVGLDHQLWQISWTGTSWTPWIPQGGQLTSAPATVTARPGAVDVFGRGVDNQLWSKSWLPEGRWTGWAPLGGILVSAPTAASAGTGRIDVLVRGADGALWRIGYDGGWSGWSSFAKLP